MLEIGLNPYGLTYHLGLQGRGTPRANPEAPGLDGFIALVQELGARTIELPEDRVAPLDEAGLAALRERLAGLRMVPVLSSGLHRADLARCVEVATRLGARMTRFALTSVLCGDRSATPDWDGLVTGVRERLSGCARRAEAAGLTAMIENHQDLTSSELAGFCEEFGPAVRIVLDTGNTFPVAEAPLDFVRVVAPTCAIFTWKTTGCSRPTRATASCAVPSATAPCRSPSWRRCWPSTTTRCLAAGVMADGGRVNAVSPGPTKTARFEATRTVDPEKMDAARRSLDRYGEPDVVAFLAGPQARFVNGQVIRVDGGHLLFPG